MSDDTEGIPLEMVALALSPDDANLLRQIGEGDASAGAVRLLKSYIAASRAYIPPMLGFGPSLPGGAAPEPYDNQLWRPHL